MSMSQEESFFNELAAGHGGLPIPEAKRVYFQTRLRNRLFDYILGRFVQEQAKGLTKAKLGRRIGKPPEMINRWLGTPSNLTLDSISDLLLGICAEELTPQSESLLNQSPRNWAHAPWIRDKPTVERSEPKGANDSVELRSSGSESKGANDSVKLPSWR
jgi:hypothetical protein